MRFLRIHILIILTAALLSGCDVPVTQSISDTNKAENQAIDHHKTSMRFEDDSPVFIRITKTQSPSNASGVLEMFKRVNDGTFQHYKSWDICKYSGALGPKLREGDRQSPEGFYFVKPAQMNPDSSYHLSFNLGFPNAYDRAHGRTGSFLMVHGDCVSIGCYAMTDAGIEDIYGEMEAAFAGGQPFIRVHIFPFPMTDMNMTASRNNPNRAFWENLKTGWDLFEASQIPPNVTVSGRAYRFSTSQ